MKDPQDIFNELQELKKEQKEIRKDYRNILLQNTEYEAINDKLEALRAEKKEIELSAQAEIGATWDKFEDNKQKIKDLEQILTDVAMTNLMDGKTVEVRDIWDNLFEPVYKIIFKKAK
jgi:predicted nuclease with TOPRIM domain